MTALQIAKKLRKDFPELGEPEKFRDEVTLVLSEADRLRDVCRHAKDELGFNMLLDICSVDHYGSDPRFEVVYELYGLEHRRHLRLRVPVSEEVSEVPSVVSVWRTADWHEREIYDMMGIRFRDHGDLRRILMWDGYPYYPLRKDFPLGGKTTDIPEVAFTKEAPLEGGPFVTVAGGSDTIDREPRARGAREADE